MRKNFRKEAEDFLAKNIAGDTSDISPRELARGIKVEYEHGKSPELEGDPRTDVTGDDPDATAKIALRHLRERPDYYDGLAAYEYSPAGWFHLWGQTSFRAKLYWKIKYVVMIVMIISLIFVSTAVVFGAKTVEIPAAAAVIGLVSAILLW